MSNKSNLFNDVKNKTGKVDISGDTGMVNPKSKSSVIVRDDGNINLCIDEYTQFKMDKNMSNITQSSLSHTSSAVIEDHNFNDLVMNKHKFNNQLIELSDYRMVNQNIIGNLLMNGTVLVKSWEPTLEKWVLIRRPISTAIFSNRLNVPNTPEQLGLDLNVLEDIKKYYIDRDKEDDK